MTLEEQFNIFWEAFPKRTGRIAAMRQYQCAVYYQGATHEAIMNGVEAYKRHLIHSNTDFQFISCPQRWLNDGRWEDEYEANLPDMEHKSPQELLRHARINGFYKNGFWLEQWGDRPTLKLVC